MADTDRGEMLQQATGTSTYFSSLVELIPTKYYLADGDLGYDSNEVGETNRRKISKDMKKVFAKKAKLQKLDPSRLKTIGELQKEIEAKDEEDVNENGGGEHIRAIDLAKASSLPLDDLRKKLHDKIEQLRGKRKLKDEKSSEENAKKRKIEKSSKKKKQTNKEPKAPAIEKNRVENGKKNTKVVNDKGEVVFSKFDFAEDSSKRKKKGQGKDVKSLLKKAEKRKENLEKLEQEDRQKADELKSKIKWDKVFKHAEGQKVKDDPKLLLKTLKKKKKIKEASKRKWEERLNTQKKLQEDKQKLRKQHLKERKEMKGVKGGKNKKQSKKGRKHKPGF